MLADCIAATVLRSHTGTIIRLITVEENGTRVCS
jgi:hypothetical protein